MAKKIDIPKEILEISSKLAEAGFEAYLVGGCVRDIMRGTVHGELVEPKDWDIATDAKPEETQKIFPDSVYENQFGTVLVKIKPPMNAENTLINADNLIREDQRQSQRRSAFVVEVTTFRLEGRYTDKRHPDEVVFARTIEDDLSRRDFTINAMALRLEKDGPGELIDPYDGMADLVSKMVRTVGDPKQRFNEDALRLLRAVRFAAELDFQIEMNTRRVIEREAGLLEMIAKERIRDEFAKIIMSPRAAAGIITLEEMDLLRYILPELREGLGVPQNKHHIYTVFEHSVRSLDYAAKSGYDLPVRLAALLHDIGKPKTKGGEGPDATFYSHEMVGAKMAARALERLRFSKEVIERVYHLVRYHMFYYNVDEVSAAGVRRFLNRVGPENVDDLLKVREADRIGSGVPKAVPYKMRHLLFMIEKVKNDPISPKMLKVNGEDVMALSGLEPGPRVGQILYILLEDVLDEPGKNEKEYLENRIKELNKLKDSDLAALSEKAREKKDESQEGIEDEMKKKFHV